MKLPPSGDTITAIATPPGYGGIGVIRISGTRAFAVAAALVADPLDFTQLKSHTLHHCYLRGSHRRPITDEVILGVFRAPHSYTGEHVVEISAHGNPQILKQIVEMAIAAGCRQAAPGEFTLRAFQNGRLDLLQAEAVADLIAAEGTAFQQAAMYQLSGKLSEFIGDLRNKLVEIAALFEAYTDFPDEEIPPQEKSQLLGNIDAAGARLQRLADSYARGEILRDGIQVPIVGPPNAGKSSLFNAILAEERAIVTEIPGTTRDTIAEKIELDGIIVRFIDTAGMRETDDRIESIGVERARREIAGAQIVIAVFDAAKTSIAAIREFLDGYAGKQIALVLNKIDLLTEAQIANLDAEFQAAFPSLVSARNLVGIDELLARISRYIANTMQPLGTDNNLLTNPRHQRCILSAVAALGAVRAKLAADESFELLAFDLRLAVEALEEILGRITNEDLLAEIFSRFCIGK